MCLICVEIEKEKLTFKEAWSNFKEMKVGMSEEHQKEVKQLLVDKMVEEKKKEFNFREE